MASSLRPAILFTCILAIFMCLAGVGHARNPLETHEQPLLTTLQSQQGSGDLVEGKIAFDDPNSDDHVLHLPSEKDDLISMENPQEQPDHVYPKWEPRFPVQRRPFIMPFQRELGRSRFQDERDLIFRRFPLGSRWPIKFGRPGGCDQSKREHLLRGRGDYGRRYFPGSKGPDSITLRLDFDGEMGAFHIFPIQTQSPEFRPEHTFGPADTGESTPYDSPVINEDVPTQHLHWAAVARSHEEEEEGPAGRSMRWLKSLFHRP